MTVRNIPVLTISLVIILAALHWLPVDKSLLYFSATDISRGEIWRAFSGHLVHADVRHLWWNILGLSVLGMLIEYHSKKLMLAAIGIGVIAVDVLLLSPFSQLGYYCGLSGVLNALLLIALWLEWERNRSRLIVVIGVACTIKTIVEVSLGSSLLTEISWPPYAWSHVAGLSGGLVLVWIQVIEKGLAANSSNVVHD